MTSTTNTDTIPQLACMDCGLPITFSETFKSRITDKRIPLNMDGKRHICEYKQQSNRYFKCAKGCGATLYHDVKIKTLTGKWIPLSKETGERHICVRT